MTGQPYFMQGDSSVGCLVPGDSYPMVGYAEGGDAYYVSADDEDVGYDDLVGEDDDLDQDVEEIAGAVNDMFTRAGVKIREWDDDGVAYCEMTIPAPRPIIITARVAMPDEALTTVAGEADDDEVGRSRRSRRRARGRERRKARRAKIKRFVKKSAKAVKKVAKKVAKSKVFKAIAKVAPMIASVIPGGQVLTAGIAVAKTASKLVQRAKRGDGPARRLVKRVASRVRTGRLRAKVKTALKSKLRARLTTRSSPSRPRSRRYTVKRGGRSRAVTLGA